MASDTNNASPNQRPPKTKSHLEVHGFATGNSNSRVASMDSASRGQLSTLTQQPDAQDATQPQRKESLSHIQHGLTKYSKVSPSNSSSQLDPVLLLLPLRVLSPGAVSLAKSASPNLRSPGSVTLVTPRTALSFGHPIHGPVILHGLLPVYGSTAMEGTCIVGMSGSCGAAGAPQTQPAIHHHVLQPHPTQNTTTITATAKNNNTNLTTDITATGTGFPHLPAMHLPSQPAARGGGCLRSLSGSTCSSSSSSRSSRGKGKGHRSGGRDTQTIELPEVADAVSLGAHEDLPATCMGGPGLWRASLESRRAQSRASHTAAHAHPPVRRGSHPVAVAWEPRDQLPPLPHAVPNALHHAPAQNEGAWGPSAGSVTSGGANGINTAIAATVATATKMPAVATVRTRDGYNVQQQRGPLSPLRLPSLTSLPTAATRAAAARAVHRSMQAAEAAATAGITVGVTAQAAAPGAAGEGFVPNATLGRRSGTWVCRPQAQQMDSFVGFVESCVAAAPDEVGVVGGLAPLAAYHHACRV